MKIIERNKNLLLQECNPYRKVRNRLIWNDGLAKEFQCLIGRLVTIVRDYGEHLKTVSIPNRKVRNGQQIP